MQGYIIGTAGHVDHGKTRLIRALTGVDTDRLKEEKERGISIELGFAALSLPSGNTAGVVDVPGHEKFVRQMLAGIGGIDLVLLIIAADEGVMPQTKEHLEIIDLLQISQGLIILTKVDLVDEDWCDLVKVEISETLHGTVLEQAEIIEVSAVTGFGIDYLRKRIDQELSKLPGKDRSGPCRLPIDRSFSVAGFGTVVTGTMYRGRLHTGDPVVVEPGGLESRVRSLQVHGNKVEEAYAGQRVAVNLPNIDLNNIPRGATVLSPGYLNPCQILDLSLEYLNSAEAPLSHRQRVRFHIGTKEALGRIHLLDREEVQPGDHCYAQILLEEPVIAARKDRFIIRHFSPVRTIAGGTILDTGNSKSKRFAAASITQLAIKERGTPADLIIEHLSKGAVPVTLGEITQTTGLSSSEVEQGLRELNGRVDFFVLDGQDYWLSMETFAALTGQLLRLINEHQERYSLRPGIAKEEVKSRLFVNWNNKLYSAILKHLQNRRTIEVNGNYLCLPGFRPQPRGDLLQMATKTLTEFQTAKLSPPEWVSVMRKYNIDQTIGEELLQYYLRRGDMVKVADNLYFSSSALEEAKEIVLRLLQEKSEFSASEAKDRLNTSRKYLIPLLEYFDKLKLTRRQGDKRTKY